MYSFAAVRKVLETREIEPGSQVIDFIYWKKDRAMRQPFPSEA